MPTNHRARLRAPVEVGFACPSCGFAARAIVEGEGVGTATSYILVDRANARERAAEEAVAEARHDAQVIASIAPCPRCTKRSRSAVVAYVVKSLLAVTAFIGLAVVALVISNGWPRWFLPPLLLAAGLASARHRRTRYELAGAMLKNLRVEPVLPRAEVRALPPAPARKPVAPPEKVEPTPSGEEPRTLR